MNIIQQYQRMATEYIFHVLLAALGIATLILNVVVFLVGLRLPFAKPKSAPISSLPSRPKRKRRTLPVQDKALLQEQLDPLDPCEADPLAIDEHESQATPTPTKKRWSSPAKFFSPDFFPFSPRPSICSDATSTTLCSPSPPRYHPELSRVSSAGSLAEASFSKCPSTPSRPSSPSRPSFFTAHRPTMSVRLPSISLLTTKLRRSSTVADPGEVDRPRAASDPCVWAEKRSPPSEPPALARRASTKPTSPRSKCQTSSRPSASHARCSSRSPPSVVPPRTSSNAPQALPRQVPSSASQASPRRMSSHASQALPHRTPSSSPHVRPRQMSTPASPRRQRTGAGAEGSRGAPQSEEVHTTFVNPFRIKPRRAKTLSLPFTKHKSVDPCNCESEAPKGSESPKSQEGSDPNHTSSCKESKSHPTRRRSLSSYFNINVSIPAALRPPGLKRCRTISAAPASVPPTAPRVPRTQPYGHPHYARMPTDVKVARAPSKVQSSSSSPQPRRKGSQMELEQSRGAPRNERQQAAREPRTAARETVRTSNALGLSFNEDDRAHRRGTRH
ncbi:hypothetical protein AcV5_004935 [Taiwanofungus camphoratus]|nr:hypothetical protein AcV5_004935 [Antrodia cinnamomea]